MKLINDTLATLSLSTPQAFSNLAVFPLIAQAAHDADYLVLDEALMRKLARVTEVSEGGSVPELAFENDADVGVLLLDGEELVGARQNRVLNITVLVGEHSKIVIPVSCVEHGRWRYNSNEFASADRALFLKARAKKARQVSASLRDSGTYRSDQREVWDDIAEKSAAFSARSETGAMGDVFEQQKVRLDEYVEAVSAAPGQCGAVFAIDGTVVGLEIFDSPGTFARYLPKLVRSYAMDAAETAKPKAVLPVADAVRQFIEEMQAAATESFKAVGEGDNVRIESDAIAGGALVHEKRIVHLAAFKMEGHNPARLHRAPLRRSSVRPG
jgi:hypothetical protein